MDEMIEGERVLVKLHGDDRWREGTVLDRPRKMWVELDDGFIADENSIESWRRPDSSGADNGEPSR